MTIHLGRTDVPLLTAPSIGVNRFRQPFQGGPVVGREGGECERGRGASSPRKFATVANSLPPVSRWRGGTSDLPGASSPIRQPLGKGPGVANSVALGAFPALDQDSLQ